jgi:molybdopterin synthase catalytic subunit
MEDWIQLTAEAIGAEPAVRFVTHPDAGGIDVFLGTTRAEMSVSGQRLAALDYEAYPDMALARMRALAADARRRWAIVKVAMLHRTGRVALAEPSVVIAVSTGHRAEAFEACRYLIDALKAEAPIWKKEVWADGSTSWVEGQAVEKQ